MSLDMVTSVIDGWVLKARVFRIALLRLKSTHLPSDP